MFNLMLDKVITQKYVRLTAELLSVACCSMLCVKANCHYSEQVKTNADKTFFLQIPFASSCP